MRIRRSLKSRVYYYAYRIFVAGDPAGQPWVVGLNGPIADITASELPLSL